MRLLVKRLLRKFQVRLYTFARQSEAHDEGNSRRINPDRGALTLLTDSTPGGKNSGAIHYDQNRTLTVAERKRLQGVPDQYHICGSVEDVSQATVSGYGVGTDHTRRTDKLVI
jgi:site-specific DNA-cytosine methylase